MTISQQASEQFWQQTIKQVAASASWILFLLPMAPTIEAQDFTYSNNNGALTITGYTGQNLNVIIPSVIDGLPVTSVGDSAFFSQYSLTSVAIPSGVTNIGFQTFYGCGSVTNISIPDTVTTFGEGAFFACGSLLSVAIPTGITRIGGGGTTGAYGTFEGCGSLTSLDIPDGVTNIGDGPFQIGGALGAFYGCTGLTNVVIGNGLSYLGIGAFSWCTNLVSIYFKGNAPTPGQDMFGADIFHVSDRVTLYYLPGTTGWTSAYAGRPAVLWNPIAEIGDGNFGVRQNRFGFDVVGTADIPLVIEASTDLTGHSWVPLQTCTLTNGSFYFSDPQWVNYSSRLYRIRSP